jgi:hypothetical protein
MNSATRRLSRLLGTLMTAFAVMLTLGNPASAAMNGESSSWTPEQLPTGGLWSSDTLGEARDTDNVALRMWRADDLSGAIWASYNGGPAYQLNGSTRFAPEVVAFGNGFAAFHTGNDDRVYWATTQGGAHAGEWTAWSAVPGQYAGTRISATQVTSSGDRALYIAYRAPGEDTTLWGTYFDGSSWHNAQRMGDGTSWTGPSVTFDRATDRIWAAMTGANERPHYAYQYRGQSTWSSWLPLEGSPDSFHPPAIAADESGNVLFGVVGMDARISYQAHNTTTGYWSGWSQDITNWQTIDEIAFAVTHGGDFYSLITGLTDQVWFKRTYHR